MAACQRHRGVCQLLVEAGASLRTTDSKVTKPNKPTELYCRGVDLECIHLGQYCGKGILEVLEFFFQPCATSVHFNVIPTDLW